MAWSVLWSLVLMIVLLLNRAQTDLTAPEPGCAGPPVLCCDGCNRGGCFCDETCLELLDCCHDYISTCQPMDMKDLSCSEDAEFEAWKLMFDVVYEDAEEESTSKMVWMANCNLVREHNLQADLGIISYELALTRLADKDDDNYTAIMLQGIQRPEQDLTVVQPSQSTLSGIVCTNSILIIDTYVPDAIDWRDEGYVTPVKDQTLSCGGSSWAFSATGALEGQTFRKNGTLCDLSVQQLIDCSDDFGNNGCHGGGWMNNAFKYIAVIGGIELETTYPYDPHDQGCDYNASLAVADCTGFADVKPFNENDLKVTVGTYGPVSAVIDASQPTFKLFSSTGIYDEPNCNSTNLNHAVLVVGYGSDNGVDYWLVKNSWGTEWGDEGYIKMSRNKNNQCGIASAASYPLV